jgi:hypothetical protein
MKGKKLFYFIFIMLSLIKEIAFKIITAEGRLRWSPNIVIDTYCKPETTMESYILLVIAP